jgi:hypothetical protein
MEPGPVTRGGVQLACSVCSEQRFVERSALLNTRGMTWLGLDWLNEGAQVYVCVNCGHLEWFAAGPGPATSEPTAITCLSCGNLIPPGTDRCLNCGWTYAPAGDDNA